MQINNIFAMRGSFTVSDNTGLAGFLGAMFAVWIICMVIIIAMIVAQWKIFTKAGKPGWASLVPVYNFIVALEIIGRPMWWLILTFIPGVNAIIGIIIAIDLAKSFGKQGTGWILGMIFASPIMMLILGFGDAQYVGPAAAAGNPMAPQQPMDQPMNQQPMGQPVQAQQSMNQQPVQSPSGQQPVQPMGQPMGQSAQPQQPVDQNQNNQQNTGF